MAQQFGTLAFSCNAVINRSKIEAKTRTNGFFNLQMSADNGPDVCDLYVDAPMYRQHHVTLRLDPSLYSVQIGTLVLQSVNNSGEAGNSTISALSLAAPPKAREAFETGVKKGRNGKLTAACEHFRKAIQLYPRYALAWLELGRAQTLQGNVVEAQHSFEEAEAQDSHLLSAYVELTRLTAKQNQWLVVQHTTDRSSAGLSRGFGTMVLFLQLVRESASRRS